MIVIKKIKQVILLVYNIGIYKRSAIIQDLDKSFVPLILLDYFMSAILIIKDKLSFLFAIPTFINDQLKS